MMTPENSTPAVVPFIPQIRTRRFLTILGWSCAALPLLGALVSMISVTEVDVKAYWGRLSISLFHGVFSVDWNQNQHFVNYDDNVIAFKGAGFDICRPYGENFAWSYTHFSQGWNGHTGRLQFSVHLLVPFFVFGLLTLYHQRQLRRLFPPGACLGCGYNLTGAPHAKCPECGLLLTVNPIRQIGRRLWIGRMRLAALAVIVLVALVGTIAIFGTNNFKSKSLSQTNVSRLMNRIQPGWNASPTTQTTSARQPAYLTGLLLEAAGDALQRKDFDMVVKYADQILAIDPNSPEGQWLKLHVQNLGTGNMIDMSNPNQPVVIQTPYPIP